MGVPFIDKQFEQAQQYHMSAQFAEADRLYRKILSNQPNHAGAIHFLGLLAHHTGKPTDALPLMRRSIALEPGRAEYYNNLGEVFRVLNKDNEAVECFQRAIALNPRIPDSYNNIAILLSNQRRYAEAIPWSRKALEVRPDFIIAMYSLAQALFEAEQNDEATDWVARILEREPDHAEALYLRACINGRDVPPTAPAGYVTRLFNGYAQNFDQHLVDGLGYHVPEKLRQTIDRLDPQRMFDILDLGCGTGLVGAAFRERAKSLAGVDLAPAMIEKSTARGVYDALELGELTSSLQTRHGQLDLVLSADVFIYIGELRQIFAATAQALRPDGLFAFSVEVHTGDGYILQRTRRYAHSRLYIQRLADENGFKVVSCENVVIRLGQGAEPINGIILVLRRVPSRGDLPAQSAAGQGASDGGG